MSNVISPINPTFVIGEDGSPTLTKGEDLTTTALGEEEPVLTTHAIGEEDGGGLTSDLRGEEDLSTSLRGEEDGGGGVISPLDPTLQNPFGGF